MFMARNFEDIEIWQLARALVKNIFTLAATDKLKRYYCFVDQIQRAALSVMNNISEGFERKSNKEFIYFLYISKGSVGELRSMLYVLLDLNLLNDMDFKSLHEQSLNISKSLSGFISYLKNNTIKQ
jgi:four helix bundle protein